MLLTNSIQECKFIFGRTKSHWTLFSIDTERAYLQIGNQAGQRTKAVIIKSCLSIHSNGGRYFNTEQAT
jgi:hypothetical protein